MSGDRSSISKARTYRQIGEFWDAHDLSEYWEHTQPAEFTHDSEPEVAYYPLEPTLAAKVHDVARQRGVSVETLLNLWVQEKLQEQTT